VLATLLGNPLSRLFAQVVVIVTVSRLLGVAMRRIGQPMVVAEVTAGIMLGPSLLGWLTPEVSAALFPPDSLTIVQMLAQVGLVLFMFLVGLELDPRLLRGRTHTSVAISHTSIICPFLLGVGLAWFIHDDYADPNVRYSAFALFMGAAMSITAFPVLARILAERRLLRTRVGAITIACAAVDDVTAWCILAFVVAVTRASGLDSAITTTVLAVGYILVVLWLVRPLVRRMAARVASPAGIPQNAVAAVLLLVFLSSWTTELIGIHALFGAFLFGAVLPKEGGFARALIDKLEDLVLVVFLPLFFVFSGLRTEIRLIDSAESWAVCGLIILIACIGKFGGSAVAARLTGLGWRESSALGILMNTRGLMELVVLNIGLDLGVISPTVFSMMVIMALVTTFATSPLIRWVYPAERMAQDLIDAGEGVPEPTRASATAPAPAEGEALSLMLCISHRQAGTGLAAMAAALVRGEKAARIDAVHLVPAIGRGGTAMVGKGPGEGAGEDVLAPVMARTAELGVEARMLSFISDDPARDICELAVARDADLVLLGWHKPVLSQTLLGGVVHDVMNRCPATVGVLVDRGLGPIKRVLVPYAGSAHDQSALRLARQLMKASGAQVTILHVKREVGAGDAPAGESAPVGGARTLVESVFSEDSGAVKLQVVAHRSPAEAALAESGRGYDLVIVGIGRDWGLGDRRLGIGLQPERLMSESPVSLLVVRGQEISPRRRLVRATARGA